MTVFSKWLKRLPSPADSIASPVVDGVQPYHDHVVVDIETLSTSASAVVFSIGAARIPVGDQPLQTDAYFYTLLPITQQLQASRPREKDLATLSWWSAIEAKEKEAMEKDSSCRALASTELTIAYECEIDLKESLLEFSAYLKQFPKCRIWGNGPSFDMAILRNLYSWAGLDLPWDFVNERCVRSFGAVGKKLGVERVKSEIQHHALSDATAEAQWMRNIHDAIPDKRMSVID